MSISTKNDRPVSEKKSDVTTPTVTQLEEALEERIKSDRRGNENPVEVETDRRVAERRTVTDDTDT